MSKIKKVFIESPYSGNIEENVEYARECMADSLLRGEGPFLSHLIYTQFPKKGFVSDDDKEHKIIGRENSIKAAEEWRKVSDLVVFYIDKGMSKGMLEGKRKTEELGIPIEYRKIK